MSDTTPAGAPGLTRAEIGERLARPSAETTPSAGQALLARWKAIERTPQYPRDLDAMAAEIDAALAQARREGAEAMREACNAACEAAKTATSGGMSYGWNRALDEAQEAIDALPLPGDAS